MNTESRAAFFRQSGWLAIATGASGVFLVAVYPVLVRLPAEEFPIYFSLLRLFTVLAMAAAGLQIVMAQDAAAAITPEEQRDLAATVRSVGRGVAGLWLAMLFVCALLQEQIVATFKITNVWAVWVTMALVLAQLCLPLFQGLLQGAQNFAWLGGSILLNGLGRFIAIAAAVFAFNAHATGALVGALVGLAAAVAAGIWPSRHLFRSEPGKFDWAPWLKRVLPLSAGTSSILFLINADMLFVQSHFTEIQARYYAAVAMVGVGLVTLTTPMAAVMFPKLVSSMARGQQSTSFSMALAGTLILGLFAAIVCTLVPSLPLRIMYFNQPDLWVSAQLVPWFMWCILPVTIANVLIAHLLAKRKFNVVPWLIAIAAGYGLSIHTYLGAVPVTDHFAAFKGIILRLGLFSLLLLAISALFSWKTRTGASPVTAASP